VGVVVNVSVRQVILFRRWWKMILVTPQQLLAYVTIEWVLVAVRVNLLMLMLELLEEE
jgi:hypothetical protein